MPRPKICEDLRNLWISSSATRIEINLPCSFSPSAIANSALPNALSCRPQKKITPPPAPPDTPDLSDQLRYAIEVFEDCVVVHEGWHERARYGLGESPVEWTE